MSISSKKKLFVFLTAVFSALVLICAVMLFYIISPAHPRNITDETVVKEGVEYSVELNGISTSDETGFRVATEGFYTGSEKVGVYVNEKGYACTTQDGEGETYVLGKYSPMTVSYDKFSFCSETYKTKEEFQEFLDSADPIYGFDVNKIPEYVSNIINYEKKFSGKVTVKIYRGRCVITDFYIGDERILELKK